MTIDRAGNVGIGQPRPDHPLEMASGAHVSAGGVWTNSSSIANKENVEALDPEAALAALAGGTDVDVRVIDRRGRVIGEAGVNPE